MIVIIYFIISGLIRTLGSKEKQNTFSTFGTYKYCQSPSGFLVFLAKRWSPFSQSTSNFLRTDLSPNSANAFLYIDFLSRPPLFGLPLWSRDSASKEQILRIKSSSSLLRLLFSFSFFSHKCWNLIRRLIDQLWCLFLETIVSLTHKKNKKKLSVRSAKFTFNMKGWHCERQISIKEENFS